MVRLVGYASSEDESEPELQSAPQPSPPPVSSNSKPIDETKTQAPSPPQPAPQLGPHLPPANASLSTLPEPDDDDEPDDNAPVSSPYTTQRSLIHDLTLPAIPDLNIPPSPPPPDPHSAAAAVLAATSEKFAQSLRAGASATVNEKLEQSAAVRNPALMDKLLGYMDIPPPVCGGRDGDDSVINTLQYQTSLPLDLWNPHAFPRWAFRDRLRRTRDKVAREREAAKMKGGRTAVDFVPASVTGGGGGGGGGRVGGLSRVERKKTWE